MHMINKVIYHSHIAIKAKPAGSNPYSYVYQLTHTIATAGQYS